MTEFADISPEQLQAFVDGELSVDDRLRILSAMELSPELRDRVGEIRQLKDMVTGAYADVPQAPSPRRAHRARAAGYALAATGGAMCAALVIAAWGLWAPLGDGDMGAPVQIASIPTTINATETVSDQSKVLFHISSADPAVAEELLAQVELALKRYRRADRHLRVSIVANGEGLRLYQVGRSSHAARIRELFDRYDNITFAACGNTMNRFRRDRGERVDLVPEAIVIDSGVAEIARRQQQGWSYIRI